MGACASVAFVCVPLTASVHTVCADTHKRIHEHVRVFVEAVSHILFSDSLPGLHGFLSA